MLYLAGTPKTARPTGLFKYSSATFTKPRMRSASTSSGEMVLPPGINKLIKSSALPFGSAPHFCGSMPASQASAYERPISRFTERNTTCLTPSPLIFRASWPTKTAPLSLYATTDGITGFPGFDPGAGTTTKRPSALKTATQELVVPKSMPIASPSSSSSSAALGGGLAVAAFSGFAMRASSGFSVRTCCRTIRNSVRSGYLSTISPISGTSHDPSAIASRGSPWR
mmetsp:Transcript_75126/g.215187  ORF Transcript_75126/g.215187 Transcript_75126/m.215187 type:complete len:226 (-) Transcript_75126:1-678(-)